MELDVPIMLFEGLVILLLVVFIIMLDAIARDKERGLDIYRSKSVCSEKLKEKILDLIIENEKMSEELNKFRSGEPIPEN